MKIHVIPSSKIAISVILSCWLLGKTSCLATVAKIFRFLNGTTPENVKHVVTDISSIAGTKMIPPPPKKAPRPHLAYHTLQQILYKDF